MGRYWKRGGTPISKPRQYFTRQTAYGRIKNLLYLENFHAKSFNGVMQEIFANLLVMSLAAAVDVEASQKLKLNREECIPNFKSVVHVLRRYFAFIATINRLSKNKAQQTYEDMLREAGLILYEKRPGRSYPRVSKQPIKSHNLCKQRKLAEFAKKSGKRK